MKNLLSFLLTTIITLNFFSKIKSQIGGQFKYRYDSCDPKWANDTLWSNYISNTNSTICNDRELASKRLPAGFVTLVADAFANNKIPCGDESQICNPGLLNKFLIKCGEFINRPENVKKNITIFKCIGLKSIDKRMRLNEIDDYVFSGYTLLAADFKNSNDTNAQGEINNLNRFIIEGVYDDFYIRGIDYRGRSLVMHHEEATNIEVFKISKVRRNRRKGKGKKAKKRENEITLEDLGLVPSSNDTKIIEGEGKLNSMNNNLNAEEQRKIKMNEKVNVDYNENLELEKVDDL